MSPGWLIVCLQEDSASSSLERSLFEFLQVVSHRYDAAVANNLQPPMSVNLYAARQRGEDRNCTFYTPW